MSTPVRVHRGLAYLFLGLGLVQFFLAGLGTFGERDAFNVHRGIGSLLVLISLVLLILALVRRKEAVAASALLFGLMIVQMVLGVSGYDAPILGALHAVNALVLLGVASLVASGAALPFGGGRGRASAPRA